MIQTSSPAIDVRISGHARPACSSRKRPSAFGSPCIIGVTVLPSRFVKNADREIEPAKLSQSGFVCPSTNIIASKLIIGLWINEHNSDLG